MLTRMRSEPPRFANAVSFEDQEEVYETPRTILKLHELRNMLYVTQEMIDDSIQHLHDVARQQIMQHYISEKVQLMLRIMEVEIFACQQPCEPYTSLWQQWVDMSHELYALSGAEFCDSLHFALDGFLNIAAAAGYA